MPIHDVKFTLPERPLGKVDAEFAVQKDGELLGTLKVSHGAVVWAPKRKAGKKLSWSKRAALFEQHGRDI
jgi:hypothetical protein